MHELEYLKKIYDQKYRDELKQLKKGFEQKEWDLRRTINLGKGMLDQKIKQHGNRIHETQ